MPAPNDRPVAAVSAEAAKTTTIGTQNA